MADPKVVAFRDRLGAALKNALKARDSNAVSAFRSTLSTTANAEAVPEAPGRTFSPRIGVGVREVARRELSAADLTRIIEAEIAERAHAASEYDLLGRADQATALRDQAAVLRRFLEGST